MLWYKLRGECRRCVHCPNAETCPYDSCRECPCDGGGEDTKFECLCSGAEYGEDDGVCHKFLRDTTINSYGYRICFTQR